MPVVPLTLTPRVAAEVLFRTHGITLASPLQPLGSELASTFRARPDAASQSALGATGLGPTELAVKIQASDPMELQAQRWRAEVAETLSATGLPVPGCVRAQGGELVGVDSAAGTVVAVTVTRWVAGTPYGEPTAGAPGIPDVTRLGHELGATAARLQAALTTAPRPPHPLTHSWAAEAMHATLSDHLPRVTDPEVRTIAKQALALLEREVSPYAGELPRTLVHQDLHDSNVLVSADGRIAAIIDFDDMLIGWRVAEPAIAAAYLARHAAAPEPAVAAVAAGWEAELPFTAAERRVFPALVLARLALNITIWHVRISDSRAEYAQMRATGSERTFHALHTAWARAREHAR